jgi:hypothetical protein
VFICGQFLSRHGNVGIGTTNRQYKLAVNGNIGAQDIIVTNTGWSDWLSTWALGCAEPGQHRPEPGSREGRTERIREAY